MSETFDRAGIERRLADGGSCDMWSYLDVANTDLRTALAEIDRLHAVTISACDALSAAEDRLRVIEDAARDVVTPCSVDRHYCYAHHANGPCPMATLAEALGIHRPEAE